ncbi:heavy metal translocating P-type ATPase [Lentzea sp. HUAS12]|uniref:heavy metal translocating P-type ATPase n=1 Tax=Lentzea sp. HUAS12 TaxID=2951806 RepID=UPI0020A075FC|nr:heavy metal translocating P-type ATPase [Lentzea sp. HUAS12]USX54470.1 heavy metal translocating P-type ATPase [Lentzea sp. HUAS12]
MKVRTGHLFLTAVVLTTLAGGVVWFQDPQSARTWWAVATATAVVPAVWWVVEDLRAKRFGADVLAVFALVGTFAIGEHLAGAVVAVMVGTGHALDDYARRRARRDLSALLERAPSRTWVRANGDLRTIEVDAVRPGDEVVVRPGEVVPVDGVLLGDATFDESALTGEPEPVTRLRGERVRSGVVATGSVADVRASASAAESTYAGVVRLAEEAAARSAPVVRVADRVAAVFLPVAVLVAGLAAVLTGDLTRAVAVLVTATPCPLLLAVPVAITAGMSRASRAGVVVRDGQALEALGNVRTAVLDKTGTVTVGRPVVVDVVPAPRWFPSGVLGLAASVEQFSTHALASAVVEAARTAGLHVDPAQDVHERPGHGVGGRVGTAAVFVGARDEEPEQAWELAAAAKARLDAATPVWVRADDGYVGTLLLRDPLRREAGRTVQRLRAAGLRRLVMLTGDRPAVAQDVAAILGLDDVVARCTPEDKVARVREERSCGVTLMVGDGINDAPALAAADVGVALGGRGSAAAAQAADAVVLDDRIDRLADAVEIAGNARRIAVQSAAAGMGLALVAMGFAALGLLPPIGGALVQEAIDVAVILYSLRALLPLRHGRVRAGTAGLLSRFDAEHVALQEVRDAVRIAADSLHAGMTEEAATAVRKAHELAVERLLPHERAEEHELYPVLTAEFRDPHATVPMSRGHVEIERLVRRLGRHLDEPGGLTADQVDDLRATLYGLDAVLRLHFAQEEESYFVLADHR